MAVHPGIGALEYLDYDANVTHKDEWSITIVGRQDWAALGAHTDVPLRYGYANTCYVQQSGAVANTGIEIGEATAEGWLLLDSDSDPVPSLSFAYYLADIGNPDYYQRFAEAVYDDALAAGLTGIFLDNVDIDFRNLVGTVNIPINPRTGLAYTQPDWADDSAAAYAYIGEYLQTNGMYLAGNANAFITGNSASNTGALTKTWWDMLTYTGAWRTGQGVFDHFMVERWMRTSGRGNTRLVTEDAYWNFFDGWQSLVAYVQAKGSSFIAYDDEDHPAGVTDELACRYNRACFLLDWNGGAGAAIFKTSPDDPWTIDSVNVDLGMPTGAKVEVLTDVWQRQYDNGYVVVNPTTSTIIVPGTGETIASGDAIIVLVEPPPAAVLYGARGGSATTSDLYTINPATAAPTAVGPIGYAVTALAFDPTDGTLYGVTSNNSAADPHSLITVDPVTGTGTLIGDLGDGTNNCSDIAIGADGILYGWTTATSELVTINKVTGAMTPVDGFTGEFAGGISFIDVVLWHVTGSTTGTLDTATGEETFVANVFDGGQLQAAAYGEGQMYASIKSGSNSRLKTMDVAVDGTPTTIGSMFTSGDPMDALAWGPEPEPPPPPTPFTGRVYADLPVRIFATSITSRTLTVLDHRATGRQFMFVLNGPAYHTGQVASDDVEINRPFPDADSPALISNNVRLVYALQRWKSASPPYTCIFGGILMTPEDQGSDAPTTRYTAYDPWQMMMSRPVRDPDSSELPGVDGLKFPPGSLASDIALALLQTTEIVEGETFIDWSDSGLIEDTVPLPDGIKFDEGTMVGEAWQQLCNTGTIDITLPPLYDPIDRPGKVTQFATSPRAGRVRYNAVMAWDKPGNSLMDISRLVDGTRMANRVQFFAGQGGVPVPLQSDAASIAANGEYWAQQFFPGTHDRNMVELLALASVLIRRNGARSVSLDPAPERAVMPFRDYGLGDYLPVWASRNLREPLAIDYDNFDVDFPGAAGYQRVYAIPFDLDDNGVPRVRGILTSQETAVGG